MNELLRLALDLPPQASTIARGIDTLHYVVIATAFLVAFLSFALIGMFLIVFRENRATHPHRHFKLPPKYEIGLASATLFAFLVFWVVGFRQFRDIRTSPANALKIYVVGKQWMWEYVYPDGTAAQDELRVPVGHPVELLMTSRDVIHSFYVPAFRVKQDAVPGRITSLWFTANHPGTYQVFCAEYCGADHSRMLGRVIAMAPADYAAWLAGHEAEGLATVGEKVAAEKGCLRCHTVDGTPHLGPTWRGLYASHVPLSTGQTVIADEAYLTESMMDPLVKIHTGFAPIMPSYLGQLSGPETAAIVEYIRSLR